MKNYLEEAKRKAACRGGRCLSTKYINNCTKMLWQCESGHKWAAKYNNIQQGYWCPECSGNVKNTIFDAQKLAESKNGECLSCKYINNHTKMEWKCGVGHKWKSCFKHIRNGSWCPICVIDESKNTMQDISKLAKKYNGKCLSDKYTNSYTKMKWRCKKGHQWNTTYGNVLKGRWCPKCNISKSQEKLSNILEEFIGEKSITVRPKWLKNPETDYPLEIDIYFPKHKIAVEYNGKQHYQPVDFAGKGKEWADEQLKQIKSRDKLKQKLIKQNPDKVKHFIIFMYRDVIEKKNIKDILVRRGILCQ